MSKQEKKKQEVEMRAVLNEKQFSVILDKLNQLGAQEGKKEKLSDAYFCPNKVKSFKEIEMDEVGSYSLRVRKRENQEVSADLNIKVITSFGDHHSWQEHEVKINSYEEMKDILKVIGFKQFIEIIKNRRSFQYQGMEILLEQIEDFGAAIEIEKMVTINESDPAKESIKKLLSELGVQSSEIATKSITNIIMKEKAVF